MKLFKTIRLSAIIGLGTLLTSCSGSEKGYTVTGSLPADKKLDSIYLYSYDNKKLQGAKVVDGKFEFKGESEEPVMAQIVNEKAKFKYDFLLENADINIAFKSNGAMPDMKGGKIYDIVYAYEKDPEHRKLMDNYENFSNKLFENLDIEDEKNQDKVLKAREELFAYEDKVFKIRNEALKKVIDNKDNPPIARALAYSISGTQGISDEQYLANLEKMTKEAGGNKYIAHKIEGWNRLAEMEKRAQNVAVGKQFIDITGKDLEGKEAKLSDYVSKNKFTILEFWASWCGPCRGEIPNLKKAYAKYKNKGLEIVSYSIDEKHADWVQAAKEEQQPWINALVEGGFESEYVKMYGIQGVPASFLIDQDGKILASNEELREFDLDKTLNKFIK